MRDAYDRKIDYMRVSITDRCNLRCIYCTPGDMHFVSHDEVLRNEEFIRICKIASELGIKHIRITGGEPLARPGAIDLLREIKKLPLVEHLALTTNGVLLERHINELSDIGISAINISLDTLDRETYLAITRHDLFDQVWRGVEATLDAGIQVKLNCVPLPGLNDDDILKIAGLAEKWPIDIRFIEAMPIGQGEQFKAIDNNAILDKLFDIYPGIHISDQKRGFGPARYYTGGALKGSIGFISPLSNCFCEQCNRIRLTSMGLLKLCLYYSDGVDLKSLLRGGASDGTIKKAIGDIILHKPEKHEFKSAGKPNEQKKMWQIGG